MLDATLWQIDMGDGTWAVCCLACRLPLYRGAKPQADRVFDTHACEPVVPLTTHPHPQEAPMKLRLHGTPAECQAAAALLRQVPGLHLCDQSPPYPDRSGELVRVYVTAQLGPVTVTPDLGRAPGGDQR